MMVPLLPQDRCLLDVCLMQVMTVVVVDDDLDLLDLLQLVLSLRGVHVVVCDHGPDVMNVIREAKPDLVLLDLQAPGDRRAGLEILARLRADPMTSMIPAILMTGDHDALQRHSARLVELHATPLRKPFDVDHVLHMVEHAD